MAFGSNQLQHIYEPTVQGTYISNFEGYRSLNPSVRANVWCMQFRLAALGKFTSINVLQSEKAFNITAEGGIQVFVQSSWQNMRFWRYYSPAVLAAHGFVLNTETVYYAATWFLSGKTHHSYPNAYHAGLILNGVHIFADEFTSQTYPAGQDQRVQYEGSGLGLNGYYPSGNFYFFGGQVFDAPDGDALLIAQTLYNQGRGCDYRGHPYLKKYLVADFVPTPARVRGSRGYARAFNGLEIAQYFPGHTPEMLEDDYKDKNFPARGPAMALPPDAPTIVSRQFSDYIYEGAPPQLGTQLLSISSTGRPEHNDLRYGLLGPIRQRDGSTDMPSNWTDRVLLGGNRSCGQTVGEEVVNLITNARCTDFQLFNGVNNWQGGQFGLGTATLTYRSLVSLTRFAALRCRLTNFRLEPQVPGQVILVAALDISNNPLFQDVNTLYNLAEIKVGTLDASVTGAANKTNVGLYGNWPIPVNETTTIRAANNFTTGLPAHWNNTQYLSLSDTRIRGTIYGTKLHTVIVANVLADPTIDASEDWLDIDWRPQTQNTVDLTADYTVKLRNLWLPTRSGHVHTAGLRTPGCPNVVLPRTAQAPDGYPLTFKLTGYVWMNDCPSLNEQIHPLGTMLLPIGGRYENNMMTEQALNGTLDCLIDNNSTRATWTGGQREFSFLGRNSPITGGPVAYNYNLSPTDKYASGRPDRELKVRETCLRLNMVLMTNTQPNLSLSPRARRYIPITNFYAVPGHPDKVCVYAPISSINYINAGNSNSLSSYDVTISNVPTQTGYHGENMSVLARGSSVTIATQNLTNTVLKDSNGHYWIIQKPFTSTDIGMLIVTDF